MSPDMANTRMRLNKNVGPPNAYKNLRARRRFGVADVIACARDVGK
jgi:hypothetical protein